MRNLRLSGSIGILILMLATIANSQPSGAKVIRIDIPFAFALGDTNFKSGYCEVSVAWQGVIWLRGPDSQVKAINSQPVNSGKPAESTKLVFRRFGDRYFLSEVWVQGDGAGRELRPTRQQQEIISRGKTETVEVLARK